MISTRQFVLDDLKEILQLCNEAQAMKHDDTEENMLHMYNSLCDIKIYANQAINCIKEAARNEGKALL